MTADDLTAALRACAAGLYPLEAGIALLIANGTFLRRGDFTSRFIQHGTSISDGATMMASIDWDAAINALHAGDLPCSGGERRVPARCRHRPGRRQFCPACHRHRPRFRETAREQRI